MSEKTIKARFAPSPTGYLHLGGARTALFNWAFIEHFHQKNQSAEFLLRIEDTDFERNNDEAISEILRAMDWLGLSFHGAETYQSQRLDKYQLAAQVLINKGLAYQCYASKEELDELREIQKARGEKPRYDRRWYNSKQTPPSGIKPAIRFKNPDNGVVHWLDLIKGNIAIENNELDDFVIMRPDGAPTYNFANVVDDHDMGITHVIRGDDHVNNTPKQINLYLAFGFNVPYFGHLPMIHGDDGEKLSKRHGAVNVMEYREQGFLPEALLNYLARLGFSHGNDEIFSLTQLSQWFTWDNVQSSPARFDRQKLLWLNQQYIIKSSVERLYQLILATSESEKIKIAEQKVALPTLIELYKDRAQTVLELAQNISKFANIDKEKIYPTEFSADLANAKDVFSFLLEKFKVLTEDNWNAQTIHSLFQECLKATNKKMVLLGVPLRIALLGDKHSPSIDKIIAAIDKKIVTNILEKVV